MAASGQQQHHHPGSYLTPSSPPSLRQARNDAPRFKELKGLQTVAGEKATQMNPSKPDGVLLPVTRTMSWGPSNVSLNFLQCLLEKAVLGSYF